MNCAILLQVIIEEKELDESWTKNDSLVARAVFDNAQSWSGWMYLEIVTKETAFVDLQVFYQYSLSTPVQTQQNFTVVRCWASGGLPDAHVHQGVLQRVLCQRCVQERHQQVLVYSGRFSRQLGVASEPDLRTTRRPLLVPNGADHQPNQWHVFFSK